MLLENPDDAAEVKIGSGAPCTCHDAQFEMPVSGIFEKALSCYFSTNISNHLSPNSNIFILNSSNSFVIFD